MGFEASGYCVVRGPDKMFGQNIRQFRPVKGMAEGIIGGPPCQDFSTDRRTAPTGNGLAMLEEFARIVKVIQPDWWLMENVPAVPDVKIDGYSWQRLDVRASDFGLQQRRNRHFQFGHKDKDAVLVLERGRRQQELFPCAMAGDKRAFSALAESQGLPSTFRLDDFSRAGRRKAVGQAVALPVAKALAHAVRSIPDNAGVRVCECGCGRRVKGRADKRFALSRCRGRAMERRR